MTAQNQARKISIHVPDAELDDLVSYARKLGVTKQKAAKILFSRGLASLRDGDPVLNELQQMKADMAGLDREMIGLMVETVISLRFLADHAKAGMSTKLRDFTKEAVKNLHEKIARNEAQQ